MDHLAFQNVRISIRLDWRKFGFNRFDRSWPGRQTCDVIETCDIIKGSDGDVACLGYEPRLLAQLTTSEFSFWFATGCWKLLSLLYFTNKIIDQQEIFQTHANHVVSLRWCIFKRKKECQLSQLNPHYYLIWLKSTIGKNLYRSNRLIQCPGVLATS